MSYKAHLAAQIRLRLLFSYPSLPFSEGIQVATTKLRDKGWVEHKQRKKEIQGIRTITRDKNLWVWLHLHGTYIMNTDQQSTKGLRESVL